MPPPLQVDLRPFNLESGVRITCDLANLCANFSLPSLSVLDLGPMYAIHTDVSRASSLNASPLGHNTSVVKHVYIVSVSFLHFVNTMCGNVRLERDVVSFTFARCHLCFTRCR